MIVLGIVERGRVQDLGGDGAVAGGRERVAVGGAAGLGRAALVLAADVYPGAVLAADIVALARQSVVMTIGRSGRCRASSADR